MIFAYQGKICVFMLMLITLIGSLFSEGVSAQQQVPFQFPLDELTSLKALSNVSGPLRNSLSLDSGVFTVGKSPVGAKDSDIRGGWGGEKNGIQTICPVGVDDNQPSGSCRVISVLKTFKYTEGTRARFINDLRMQLAGNYNWISPDPNWAIKKLNDWEIQIAVAATPACVSRLIKGNSVAECFNAYKTLLIEQFCTVIIRNTDRHRGVQSDLEASAIGGAPPDYCAIDTTTGVVIKIKEAAFVTQANERYLEAEVTIQSILPILEMNARVSAWKAQREQQQYTPPKL